jgi:hypothetical protein
MKMPKIWWRQSDHTKGIQMTKSGTKVIDPRKGRKQAPVANEETLMPITDLTDAEEGVSFIIGLGVNTPAPNKGGRKAKSK